MFDTSKVASNIKSARTKMNMTQTNLADEMGVSYQAVSNWERGNSMPDISKLPDLCRILSISFEELVGEEIPETETVKKMLHGRNEEVTLEEMVKIGQLVKPDQIEEKVNETIGKGGKISFAVLMSLAPFMEKETISKLAEEIAETDSSKLCALAPFLDTKSMDSIVNKMIQNNELVVNKIVGLAPFLSKSTLNKIAEQLIRNGQANQLVAIAPFMGKEMVSGLCKDMPFELGGINKVHFYNTTSELDDLDEEDVAELAFEALKQGKDVEEYLDYMCEGDIAELAIKSLEYDRDTEIFLDYMDENDVERLAIKALELNKPIESYLDYMDEDSVKKVLLKVLKR